MEGTLDRARPLLWVLGGAAAIRLAFGNGFANYDSFYALLWGSEIAHGESPDYSAALPPTPHPLATLFGVLASPLGDGAENALVALAFVALAGVAYLAYRLGELWVNRWVGVLAAAIVLTRVPVLDYGVRAYVDIPYIALVLGAVLVETREPRERPFAVLALLALAGLLRPEAWLFTGAYLVYLWWPNRELPDWRLLALAAAAPLGWVLFDLAVTGDPLYSLTGTKDTVGALHRDTGLFDALRLAPRRLGEILREPILFGAAGGIVFCLAFLRRRAAFGAAAAAISLAAFLILATAGLAVITRYLLLPGILLAIFGAAGVLGWLSLERDDPWRLRWASFAALVVVAILAFGPQQFNRLSDLRDRVADQERIRDQLHDVTEAPGFNRDCERIAIPSTQAVPLLALWLDLRPSAISLEPVAPARGYLIEPANREVNDLFALDPHDPHSRFVPPIRLATTAANESWLVFGRCGGALPPGPVRRAAG